MKVYVCLYCPHGDYGELGKVFFDKDEAQKFIDEKNKTVSSVGFMWHFEEAEIQ